jgi:hypothetical protein
MVHTSHVGSESRFPIAEAVKPTALETVSGGIIPWLQLATVPKVLPVKYIGAAVTAYQNE